MHCRKFTVPVFIVVIAVAALFASKVSLASGSSPPPAPAGPPPPAIQTECNFVDSGGSATKFKMKTAPDAAGNWPVYNDGKWEWRYDLYSTGSYSGINQVDMLVPVCDPAVVWSGDFQIYPPGNGDPNTSGFGRWTANESVVRVPYKPQGSLFRYMIATTSVLPARNSYMGMKSGNGLYYCKSIAGPACPECPGLPFQPATINQCMQVEGHNVLLVRNANRCITEIWECGSDATCAGGTTGASCAKLPVNINVNVVPLEGTGAQAQAGTTIGDILGNQICPEGILFSASSPGCSNIRTLSGWTQICK